MMINASGAPLPFTHPPHICDFRYDGVRNNYGKEWEVLVCRICGRESWTPYTGTQDTIEYHNKRG